MQNSHTRFQYLGNVIGLIGVSVILLIAFYEQLVLHELPCPLCLLQRAAFIGIGIGFIFNLSMEVRPAHYGLIILSAVIGLMTATRQIFLHVLPDAPGYGAPIMGLHLYTWAAIGFLNVLIYSSFGLMLDKGFQKLKKNAFSQGVIILFLLLITADAVSSFLECGFSTCPENPVEYKELHKVITVPNHPNK
jgi:disulfide bond formation protein DsbB